MSSIKTSYDMLTISALYKYFALVTDSKSSSKEESMERYEAVPVM